MKGVLIVFLLLSLFGCTNKSPVSKEINLGDFDIAFLSSATKENCVNTEGSGIKCVKVPDDGYAINENDTKLVKMFSEDFLKIENLLNETENDNEKDYLSELLSEYDKWLSEDPCYDIKLSRIKGNNGDEIKVEISLTDTGELSAKKLGYKFTPTIYRIVNGKLIKQ